MLNTFAVAVMIYWLPSFAVRPRGFREDTFTFSIPCVGPLIHQVTQPRLRATAVAVYLLVVHIFGNATAPAVVGWLSDQSGDLRLGMVVAPLMALLSSALGLWGTRFVGQDGKRMRTRLRVEAIR